MGDQDQSGEGILVIMPGSQWKGLDGGTWVAQCVEIVT